MAKTNRLLDRLKKENVELRAKNKELQESNDMLLRSCQEMEKELSQASVEREDISNHPEVIQLKERIKELEDTNRMLKDMYDRAKNRSQEHVHNARGAGRKRTYTDEQVAQMRRLHQDGTSIRKIAEELGCSTGTVCKYLKIN